MKSKDKPYRRPESVLVVIYTSANEVLLLHRLGSRPYWQSVTGSLQWGEMPAAAAQRELYEETGLQSAQPSDCGWSTEFEIFADRLGEYAPGVVHNREYVFQLALEQSCKIQLNPNEHDDYCWLPYRQAAERVYSSSNRDAILSIIKTK